MNLRVGDEIAHESTLGVAIVGMEHSKVVNSGWEWGEFESRARSLVSDRCYGDLQTVLSSDLGAPRLRTVININCLRWQLPPLLYNIGLNKAGNMHRFFDFYFIIYQHLKEHSAINILHWYNNYIRLFKACHMGLKFFLYII